MINNKTKNCKSSKIKDRIIGHTGLFLLNVTYMLASKGLYRGAELTLLLYSLTEWFK